MSSSRTPSVCLYELPLTDEKKEKLKEETKVAKNKGKTFKQNAN